MNQTYPQQAKQFGQQILFNVEDIRFPLSTQGIKIVDSTGRRVKLYGGSWSGAHMCRHCVDGLQCRPLRDIARDIRYKFKMNCIRLTYSLQLFFDNNIVPQKYLKANPELIGKTSMEIFDITIKTLTEVGLMVILNNHTSTSQWCCSNDDGDGLWWSHQYPENKFFQCAQAFASRYRDNIRVIGSDLRNQIRRANGIDPTWGDNNPQTDWRRAAILCGQKVLAIAPHWLIFVGGLNYQLDLTKVNQFPIKYFPNKLVYTGHFYGFSWGINNWQQFSYDDFKKRLFNQETFVRGLGYPFLLGQFGNNCRDTSWRYMLQYLQETDIDWTYWALDGFKCDPDKDQTYGVFTNDFSSARHPDLLQDMIKAGPPPGTIIDPSIEQKPSPQHLQQWGQPFQQWGQPSQQQFCQPPQWGQPSQQWGQPSQQWGQPSQQWGQPSQQWGQPSQQWGQPSQQWGQPSQQWGQPSQQWGQTSQQWGQASQQWGQSSQQNQNQFNQQQPQYQQQWGAQSRSWGTDQ